METSPFPRLCAATLAAARPAAARFAYERGRLRPRLVHLGLGAFFRAHGALFTEEVLAGESGAGGDWGIVGASLRHPDQRERLAPQDFLYTTVANDAAGPRARLVGCLLDVLVAPASPERLVARLAAPETAIVTLTVTEKGYCHDPATGRLDAAHPAIRHDLAHPEAPGSAVGLLVAALARRRGAGLAPFTVASCDNLPANGRLLGALVRDFAALGEPGLAGWIEREVAFPASMVDRIVPAAAPGESAWVAELTGLEDAAPVIHEPFGQWVIEDRFAPGGRPAWERAGVQFAADVAPFEHAKLRMLNGSHSALAYLGYLAGHESIGAAVADPLFARFLGRFWREVIPALTAPPGLDLAVYAASLLARYANPAIRHRTWQIAMDGSQKLPQRLLSTLRENLAHDRASPCLMLAVAGWMRYVGGRDEAGREIDVRDPLAADLRRRIEQAGPAPVDRVMALLGVSAIFGADLPADPRVAAGLTAACDALARRGARAAIAELLDTAAPARH